ncbi:early nodulin-like protein 1, partial [Abrus precatorius]|uniref:Early nodulin-like protein 1 n=1 Tax=Abrus precatorius TaxID=3816 RepID=A0A8B8KJI6_ABRPR
SFIYNCLIIFLASTNTTVEAARHFKVGGQFGWHEPPLNETDFYSEWAERNRFQVGDFLGNLNQFTCHIFVYAVFEYQNDSVLSVERWDYVDCNSNDPITSFDNGKSTFNLDRPGAFYFISGTGNHCKNGQKLLVEVMSPHPIPKSPPSISLPPEGFSAMAPSPSYSLEASASVVLSSISMSPFVTFGIVMLLAS